MLFLTKPACPVGRKEISSLLEKNPTSWIFPPSHPAISCIFTDDNAVWSQVWPWGVDWQKWGKMTLRILSNSTRVSMVLVVKSGAALCWSAVIVQFGPWVSHGWVAHSHVLEQELAWGGISQLGWAERALSARLTAVGKLRRDLLASWAGQN